MEWILKWGVNLLCKFFDDSLRFMSFLKKIICRPKVTTKTIIV